MGTRNNHRDPLSWQDRPWVVAAVVLGLLALAVTARLAWADVPNFKPIAAIALFSGFFLRNTLLAMALPLVALLSTDAVIGMYDWRLAVVVYACLTMPVWLGRWMQHRGLRSPQGAQQVVRTVGWGIGGSVSGALVFFLATNWAVWQFSSWYPPTLGGLVTCYIAALPFAAYTLAGDVLISLGLFAAWGSAHQSALARRPLLTRHTT